MPEARAASANSRSYGQRCGEVDGIIAAQVVFTCQHVCTGYQWLGDRQAVEIHPIGAKFFKRRVITFLREMPHAQQAIDGR